MSTIASSPALAQQARRFYAERVLHNLPGVVEAVDQAARALASTTAEPSLTLRRRDFLFELKTAKAIWLRGMTTWMRGATQSGLLSSSLTGQLRVPSSTRHARAS